MKVEQKKFSKNLIVAAMLGILTLTGCSKSPEDKTAATSEPKAAATNGETIKVGILHSLSGTMAISETSLKDTALMAINEINANGGVLGKKLEPVIVDPASERLMKSMPMGVS